MTWRQDGASLHRAGTALGPQHTANTAIADGMDIA